MQHHCTKQKRLIEAGVTKTTHKIPSNTISDFQETLDDIENYFLANIENVLLLVDKLKKLDNFIENTNNELNRGLLNALKKLI